MAYSTSASLRPEHRSRHLRQLPPDSQTGFINVTRSAIHSALLVLPSILLMALFCGTSVQGTKMDPHYGVTCWCTVV